MKRTKVTKAASMFDLYWECPGNKSLADPSWGSSVLLIFRLIPYTHELDYEMIYLMVHYCSWYQWLTLSQRDRYIDVSEVMHMDERGAVYRWYVMGRQHASTICCGGEPASQPAEDLPTLSHSNSDRAWPFSEKAPLPKFHHQYHQPPLAFA